MIKCKKLNCEYNQNGSCIKSFPRFRVTSALTFKCDDYIPR